MLREFTYLNAADTDNPSMDREINRRITHATTTFAKLTMGVWENNKLPFHTKMTVYYTLPYTLLYGREFWTLYFQQKPPNQLLPPAFLVSGGLIRLPNLLVFSHCSSNVGSDGLVLFITSIVRWENSKWPAVWQTGLQKESMSVAPTPLQRCL